MRNKLLIICALFAFSHLVVAQPATLTVKTFNNDSSYFLVRNWPNTEYALTCSRGDSTEFLRALLYHQFIMGAPSPVFPVYETELPVYITHVSDMRIEDNLAFLCGTVSNGRGFIGKIRMTQFVSGSPFLFDIRTFGSNYSFEKIKVYYSNNDGFVVYATGTYIDTILNITYWVIVEIKNAFTSSEVITCKRLNTTNSYCYEQVDDIVVTSSSIVFVERWHDYGDVYVAFRIVNKTMGLSDPQLDYLIYDNIFNQEVNGHICATKMEWDYYAISYVFSKDKHFNRVRVFNALTMDNPMSQEFSLSEKYEPYEMVYHSAPELLTVLQRIDNESYFVPINPSNTTPYGSLSEYESNQLYCSMDTIKGTRYMAVKSRRWLMKIAPIISWLPPTCLTKIVKQINITQNMHQGANYLPAMVIVPNIQPVVLPLSTTNDLFKHDCMSN